MSMIRKMTPVAIAIAALCSAPAFADSTASASNTQMAFGNYSSNSESSNNANVRHQVLQNAKGNVGVNNAAGSNNGQANTTSVSKTLSGNASASVANEQVQVNGVFLPTGVVNSDDVSNTANVKDQVLQNASGNIGLNNAAGDSNQQGNATSLAAVGGRESNNGATASLSSFQVSATHSYSFWSVRNKAELEDQVLQNAAGNIGVNNAAGDNNQQGNGLAVATSGDGDGTANASANAIQASGFGYSENEAGVSNSASLENRVLQNASGNIGANNAAGTGNQQGNFVAVAVTDDGLAHASATATQIGLLNGAESETCANNTASLSNQVLQNASGNIGVNNAAGANNQQLNTLAVATSLEQ